MTEATQRTSDSGVSIWLDDLSRSRIESGSLQDLIANKNVVGVTTNPSIFQKALHEVGPYDPQLKELGKVDVETAVRELTTTDVRSATDIFREVAEKSAFVDGRNDPHARPAMGSVQVTGGADGLHRFPLSASGVQDQQDLLLPHILAAFLLIIL